MRWYWVSVVGLLLFLAMPVVAQDAQAELAQLRAEMQQLQARLQQLEGQVSQQDEKIEAAEDRVAEVDVPKWVHSFKPYGDFRYRAQWESAPNRDERNRQRLRARLGFKFKVHDDLDFDFRMASDSADGNPTSRNQTLGDYWSAKDLWIDRAYLDWHPGWNKGLHIKAGKMPNPFFCAGGSQLIWDSDLNPEGIALQDTIACGCNMEFFYNLGGFYAVERGNDVDSGLFGYQAGLTLKGWDDHTYWTVGSTYYDFTNVQNTAVPRWGAFNNSTFNVGGTDFYLFDYNLVEVFSEMSVNCCGNPLKVFGNWVVNTDINNQNTAWLVGTSLGQTKDPGSCKLSYSYLDIEKDAVFGLANDADPAGGVTNAYGHRVSLYYVLAPRITTGGTFFYCKRHDMPGDFQKFWWDVSFKF